MDTQESSARGGGDFHLTPDGLMGVDVSIGAAIPDTDVGPIALSSEPGDIVLPTGSEFNEHRVEMLLKKYMRSASEDTDDILGSLDARNEEDGSRVGIAMCRPWNRIDFYDRLLTFRDASKWFAKRASLSAVECARRGWTNSARDCLYCYCCSQKLHAPDSRLSLQEQDELMLHTAHAADCGWRDLHTCCDIALANIPYADATCGSLEKAKTPNTYCNGELTMWLLRQFRAQLQSLMQAMGDRICDVSFRISSPAISDRSNSLNSNRTVLLASDVFVGRNNFIDKCLSQQSFPVVNEWESSDKLQRLRNALDKVNALYKSTSAIATISASTSTNCLSLIRRDSTPSGLHSIVDEMQTQCSTLSIRQEAIALLLLLCCGWCITVTNSCDDISIATSQEQHGSKSIGKWSIYCCHCGRTVPLDKFYCTSSRAEIVLDPLAQHRSYCCWVRRQSHIPSWISLIPDSDYQRNAATTPTGWELALTSLCVPSIFCDQDHEHILHKHHTEERRLSATNLLGIRSTHAIHFDRTTNLDEGRQLSGEKAFKRVRYLLNSADI